MLLWLVTFNGYIENFSRLGMVAHTSNLRAQEAEADQSL